MAPSPTTGRSPLRISSLHDDLLIPKATAHLGEYRDYPNDRFDPKEHSVIERLTQFGITAESVAEKYDKTLQDLNWEEVLELLAESIQAHYDTIVGSVFDLYTYDRAAAPHQDEDNRWASLLDGLHSYDRMAKKYRLPLVTTFTEFREHSNLLLCLEGGAHLIRSFAHVRDLIRCGVRLFGFQYGSDTPLALNASGLTPFGREVAAYLFDHHLIIDLAHSSSLTRIQLLMMAEDLGKGHQITYTHGCTEDDPIDGWKDKMKERVISKTEWIGMIRIGAMIGLGVTQPFFKNAWAVADRIDDIAQHGGLDLVAIGTDFGGVPPIWLTEIKSPKDFHILADLLADRHGFTDEEITKVLRTNARNWLQRALTVS